MKSNPKKTNERTPDQENALTKVPTPRHHTKAFQIWKALKLRRGLNRFEAEKLGDHVLTSTVAALRANGHNIIGQWESVPTRFGRSVMVKRYWVSRG